jgi:hypothetical protein
MAKSTPKQKYLLENSDPNGLIKIFNEDFTVLAPLPDNFGMSYGSEYSAPFDMNTVSDAWKKAYALSGISTKVGIQMKKMYSNPEPTEFSFDMEFNAYYSPLEEVLFPVYYLSQMTLGSSLSFNDLSQATQNFLKKLNQGIKTASNAVGLETTEGPLQGAVEYDVPDSVQSGVDGALRLINFIKSPKKVSVYFGNTMKWDNMYITSVATSFSNMLDANGIPMYAKCSVTVTPEAYPVAETMNRVFDVTRR